MAEALDPQVLALVQRAVLLAAWLLAPVAVAAAASGVITGAISAFTGWSEAGIGHGVRLLLVGLAWALSATSIATEVQALALLTWGAPTPPGGG